MDDSIYKDYLHDLGVQLKEYALEAKQNSVKDYNEFNAGYLSGFHRVVSLMQQQAEAFNISKEDIGLKDMDADENLV